MGSPYVGEIRMFGGNFAPAGWMFCDGSLLPIAEYDALFNLIGTTYGGDGQTTFALPDLRGRVPVHMGQGGGLSSYVIGQAAGSETVTLTASQMPTHGHTPQGSSANGTSSDPGGQVWARSPGSYQYTGAASDIAMADGSLANAGGSQPHDNMPPFLAVSFIISLFGVYPSQA